MLKRSHKGLILALAVATPAWGEASYREQYADFLADSRGQYNAFTEANERYYAESLARDWKVFNEARVDPMPSGEKPRWQPGDKTERGSAGQSAATRPDIPRATPDFFGHRVAAPPIKRPFPRLRGLERTDLIRFRRDFLAHPEFRELLRYAGFLGERYSRDLWAELQLLEVLCASLYPVGRQQSACVWILAQARGVDIRLGRSVAGLHLLIKSPQIWFDHPYFMIDGDRFQLVDKTEYLALANPRLRIHTRAHPETVSGVTIEPSRGLVPAMKHTRSFALGWDGQELHLDLDLDHVRYLYDLPNLHISVYLADSLPDYLKTQLEAAIWPELEPMSREEVILRLLDWLQNRPYQTDQAQFGYENPLTFTELLYFDASDCEDRVYALTVLVRYLLDTPVAALKFPGHLSAAVKLRNEWREADPTYLGGELGDRQPDYWNIEPNWYY